MNPFAAMAVKFVSGGATAALAMTLGLTASLADASVAPTPAPASNNAAVASPLAGVRDAVRFAVFESEADVLRIPQAAFRADLKHGITVARLAKERGLNKDQFGDRLVVNLRPRLARAGCTCASSPRPRRTSSSIASSTATSPGGTGWAADAQVNRSEWGDCPKQPPRSPTRGQAASRSTGPRLITSPLRDGVQAPITAWPWLSPPWLSASTSCVPRAGSRASLFAAIARSSRCSFW